MISRQQLGISFSLLLLAALLTPGIAIFSGLAVAPIYVITLLALVLEGFRKKALVVPFNSTIFIIVLLAGWALIAGFWAINKDQAFLAWSSTFLVILLSIFSSGALRYMRKTQLEMLTMALMIGIPLALLLVWIEMLSYGSLLAFFRVHLFNKPYPYYNVQYYNRGACFLAVMFWAMVMSFSRPLRQHQGNAKFWLVGLGLITLLTLAKLESLSAKVAFVGGVAAFVLVWSAPRVGIRMIQVAVIALAIAEPIIAPKLHPMEYLNKGLPASSVHRLFIWHFAGEKAQQKPWFGWGFYSSRDVPGGKDYIQLPNQSLPAGSVYLPNHTHNSMMQIWLELGYVGLALYVLAILSALSWILHHVRAPLQQGLMAAMLVSYLGISLFAFNVWQEWWVATGLFAFMLMRVYVDGFIEHAPNVRGGKTLL